MEENNRTYGESRHAETDGRESYAAAGRTGRIPRQQGDPRYAQQYGEQQYAQDPRYAQQYGQTPQYGEQQYAQDPATPSSTAHPTSIRLPTAVMERHRPDIRSSAGQTPSRRRATRAATAVPNRARRVRTKRAA